MREIIDLSLDNIEISIDMSPSGSGYVLWINTMEGCAVRISRIQNITLDVPGEVFGPDQWKTVGDHVVGTTDQTAR